MNAWWVMVLGGLLTYATRLSFIMLLGKGEIPDWVKRTLRLVPPAVLSAIIFPELFLHEGSLALSLENTRLVAGIVAVIAALWTRSILVTILVGMLVLIIMEFLLPG